ncbi:pyruvate dehydrogenase (acetyl-transferring), homodimeric type [Salegentibacter salarius]|uniref:Pyruvate dehydrogenase E1 component n=1 Tax=Salegentibacter salarius TaxID=435906 RepID=A0A2N0TUU4_9FLAO|nr:pyruvate dehydrogenase (acetyl-transferring), homodimeric type [Salegentibacter salarius]OEY72188.1 pyruvate dehydrogenase (acetyl-transferring), homodimeric type [Salegentibacter salarius]PKD18509.1 alpha-ketoglutarate dehydrogenase [Salegentibacter salarius]SLJ88050.1 pyruvate dehydrogenase E1 component [Salegentibacter salarius]
MANSKKDSTQQENQEWIDSLTWIIENKSTKRAEELLNILQEEAKKHDVELPETLTTPYHNTISHDKEEDYPGDLELEEKILAYIRWNAMAMVVKANKADEGIGGHISTYASIAQLWEVGFHHFFKIENNVQDQIYFQGHASPGIYARAYMEGRLTKKNLENFRHEVQSEKGLTSYPHPHLMPDFWSNPTVSMGLGPIQAIYRARFNKYLHNRGLIDEDNSKVWAFIGDGEMDEVEARGAINIASRDKLDNLIFVVDCNLQRLDGPVRGNSKVIQEMEGLFRGAGWNVMKLLWGKEWDKLIEKDKTGKLRKKLGELTDGQLQKYAYSDGEFLRKDFFESDKDLKKLVEDYSDEELGNFKRGGHDSEKIYNAYKVALETKEKPSIVLAQTVKGYGQGSAGEASNVSHKTKKFNKEQLGEFRDFFKVPVSDKDLEKIPFIKPKKDSDELKYLEEKRKDLGGYIPQRKDRSSKLKAPDVKIFESFLKGSGEDYAATTMAMVQILSKLMKDKNLGKLIVPIIPDESRTFGMESLFRQAGIYAPHGQKYDPVDEDSLLYYKEAKNGAIMEEGITESGCMAEFIAAGTTYLTHGINTIPFYFFYSMFGFQRTGDLMWAAADAGAKGFLMGGISGRTSIPGEGLQHQDGQSHLYALAFPNLRAYDPAFAYELAVIVEEGIKNMYIDKKDLFYYITIGNDTYPMPEMPEDVDRDAIINGLYRFRKSKSRKKKKKAHLFGSGAIMKEVLEAAEILEEKFDVGADIWSITSYKTLYDNAIDTERTNRLKGQVNKDENYIEQQLKDEKGTFVAASDFVKALPESLASYFPDELISLGADGFGRSDNREALRAFFEIDASHIAYAALYGLAKQDQISMEELKKAVKKLKIDPQKTNPRTA